MTFLLYLEPDDFLVNQTPEKKNVLKNKIKNFSLLLFSGNNCTYCDEVKPIFQKLVGNLPNCQVGIFNVSLYPDFVNLSQQTTTPITYVPYILFYINGIPFKEFGGNYTENNLKQFVHEVSKKASELTPGKVGTGKVSEHSVGKALTKQVCYLNFKNAYHKA